MKGYGLAVGMFVLALVQGCTTRDYQRAGTVDTLWASFGDRAWNGRVIPPGQQCIKFGGQGASPALRIGNIPAGANAVLVEFSDRTWWPMDHGGHGTIGLWLGGLWLDGLWLDSKIASVTMPSVPGSMVLPDKRLFIQAPHRGGRGKPGAYLPPCSGGHGNRYMARVMAVFQDSQSSVLPLVLAEAVIFLGRY
jgi:hypothetical protein